MLGNTPNSPKEVHLSQRDVALSQLDRAIRLFLYEKDFVSTVTLACAAEGIFGEYLKERGDKPHAEELKAALQNTVLPSLTLKEINDGYVNRARNFFKHKLNGLDERFAFEPETEAIGAIVRAASNAAVVTDSLSDMTISFFHWLKANRPEIADTSEFEREFRLSQETPLN